MRRLPRTFFARPTLDVAQDLVGKLLVRAMPRDMIVVRITETEAYRGEDDLACHASRGRTPRTEILYGNPGTAYVYLIYGMYHCLNVVTEKREFPAAVLIRSCAPVAPAQWTPTNALVGPGRLCRALDISRAQNGIDMTTPDALWLADDGMRLPPDAVATSPRIGVEYAGASAALPWRFFLHDSPFVSKQKKPGARRATRK